jgi:hypothetical protein
MTDMAIILSILEERRRGGRNFKGLSHESEWSKSDENLGPFHSEEDRLIPLLAKEISLENPFRKCLSNVKILKPPAAPLQSRDFSTILILACIN